MSIPVFRVSTMVENPFVMKNASGGYEGFVVDVLDRIAENVGFKYNMYPSKDGRYGSQMNGRWTGMIGELVSGEADIAAGALTITSMRERVVDFTKPFMSESLRLLVKKPEFGEIGLGLLLQPFSDMVWFSILIALIVVAILLMVIGRFDPYEWRQVPTDKDPRGARHSFGLRESLMFVFSTATLQGYRETPRSLAGRVLTVSWFIFIFLTVVGYIANVVALFMAGAGHSVQTLPFENIEDLVKQRSIDVGIVRHSSSFAAFRNSNVPLYKQLADLIESKNSFVSTTTEGVERVRQSDGRFVLMMESATGEYIAERDCSLMMYGPSSFSYGYAFATPIGSNIRDSITLAMLRLREDGTLQMLRKKWWKTGMCAGSHYKSRKDRPFTVTVVDIRKMAAPFLILLVGAILSVLVLVGEVVFKKLRQ